MPDIPRVTAAGSNYSEYRVRLSRRIIGRAVGCVLGLCLACSPVVTLAQSLPDLPVVDGAIDQLKSGQFLWAPQIAPQGPVTVEQLTLFTADAAAPETATASDPKE